MVVRLIIIIPLVFSSTWLFGQDIIVDEKDSSDTYYDLYFEHRNCKIPELIYVQIKVRPLFIPVIVLPQSKKALLTASGDLTYQRFQREGNTDDILLLNSSSDIVTLRLGLLYKETYPFTFSFRYNQSRPFQMDNQYEVNIGFDDRVFRQKTQEKIIAAVKNDFFKKQLQLTDQYKKAFGLLQEQKQYLQSPRYIQQAVESRLKNEVPSPAGGLPGNMQGINQKFDKVSNWLKELPGYADLEKIKQRIKDSIERRLAKLQIIDIQKKFYAQLQKKKDSLEKRIKTIEDSLVLEKDNMTAKLDSVKKYMNQIRSSSNLKKYTEQNGLKDSSGSNKWADILMKTNIRFGKFLLNQSELTVNNIFLHGASIKYGDEKFIMISGGFYDFAFRQVFNFRNDSIPNNKSSVLAVKIGKTDGDNLSAVGVYVGRKTKPGSVNDALRTVAGVSVEKRIAFSRYAAISFEVAKSTTRPNSFSSKNEQTLKDLFTHFSTKTIGLYGLTEVYLPKTNTDAEISYRYWGQQFESFNASQYFNPQNNIVGKISQPFFKRKLYLATGIRYTDFSTSGIASNMKTKSLFASANATLRLKKLPIISMGYYPGSQLYWLEQQKLYEYFYYILNVTASHHFRMGKMPVQAVFTWNKFYNKYSDSVVTGAQSYYNFFLTAGKNRFSYTTNMSRQNLHDNQLTTVEGGLTYSVRQFKIGGSIKGNFGNTNSQTGYSFCTGLVIKWIGNISFIYDKSFLPGRRGQFIPVTTGQLQIIKPLKFTLWH